MKLLLDIGGTHIRIATLKDELTLIDKYECSKFNSLEQALAFYCNEHNITAKGTLYISSAAVKNTEDKWSFTNFNKWVFTHEDLATSGWQVNAHYNDFYASAYGAVSCKNEICKEIKKGTKEYKESPYAVIGPGSGLGLAYAYQFSQGLYVQETHGGHMLANTVTDEHVTILKIVERLKASSSTIVFEDIVSGRGLSYLYRAVCLYNGVNEEELSAKDIISRAINNRDDLIVTSTLRLFHEFFGVFVHGVVIGSHAYKGVILDGGVFHALNAEGLFDYDLFAEFFILNPVRPVKKDLQNTAIFSIDTPYAALYGLKEMIHHGV